VSCHPLLAVTGRLRRIAGGPPTLPDGQYRHGFFLLSLRQAICGPADLTGPQVSRALSGSFRAARSQLLNQAVRSTRILGEVDGTLWQAHSFYDAMQVDVAKRVSHGIQLHGAYTFGKSIDTLSATEADDAFPNGLFNQLFMDQRTTRGLSDFDVAQTFVLSFTWEYLAPANGSKLPQWALGGLAVGRSYKASTGQPFTPIFGGDPLGMKLDETGELPSHTYGMAIQSTANFKKNPAGPIYHQPQLLHPASIDPSDCFPVPDLRGHRGHLRESKRQLGPQRPWLGRGCRS